MSLVLLALLGVAGGALTTVAGMGGGIFLVLALSVLVGPRAALAITSPALLLSNLHRAFLFRVAANRALAVRFAIGTVPAAILGGTFASQLPAGVIQVGMLSLTTFALLRAANVLRLKPPARAFVPLSAVVGVLSAGTGAGGFLVSPLLIAHGLTGATYIGTMALCSSIQHAARIAGYGAGGLLTSAHVVGSLALFAGLAAGNLAGRRLRGFLTPATELKLEIGALVLCTALGVCGVGVR